MDLKFSPLKVGETLLATPWIELRYCTCQAQPRVDIRTCALGQRRRRISATFVSLALALRRHSGLRFSKSAQMSHIDKCRIIGIVKFTASATFTNGDIRL